MRPTPARSFQPRHFVTVLAALLALSAAPAWSQNREAIRIVGSSTVFPFSTAVAEQFGAKTDFATPVVESTGTGGGMKLFCAGLGLEHPDITNASRRVKVSELKDCFANGVDQVVEIQIGFDGVVLANAEEAPTISLSKEKLFLALARRVPVERDGVCTLAANPYETWFDIDPALPPYPIEVFGPPTTSGTRDAFVEIAMEGGARRLPCLAALEDLAPADGETADAYVARAEALLPGLTRGDVVAQGPQGMVLLEGEDIFVRIAHTLRDDGRWIDAGENDNAIVNTLVNAPTALGVFGFSFLDQNEDRLKGAAIDGVLPSFQTIESADYTVSRSLFIYLKKGHVNAVPGLQEFVQEFTSDAAWAMFGYLSEKGLITMAPDQQAVYARTAEELPILTLDADDTFIVVAHTPDEEAVADPTIADAPETPDLP